jgi:DNA-directed RNA polymerase subunit RPC12/RpoP
MGQFDKKEVKFIIIGVCFALTILIFFLSSSGGSGGIDSLESGVMVWMKCANPKCGHAFEVDRKEYIKLQQDFQKGNPMATSVAAMKCPECGKNSCYKAYKCPECGKLFFPGAAGVGDLDDRCPYCKFSQKENDLQQKTKK